MSNWVTVHTESEQVIDQNPRVWMEAALNAENYEDAKYYADMAKKFDINCKIPELHNNSFDQELLYKFNPFQRLMAWLFKGICYLIVISIIVFILDSRPVILAFAIATKIPILFIPLILVLVLAFRLLYLILP